MIGLAIFLAAITLYLWAGIRFYARPSIARRMDDFIHGYARLAQDSDCVAIERRDAAVVSLLVTPIWPFAVLGRLITSHMASTAPKSTAERELELKQRERRVADLERELGIRNQR